MDDEWLQADKAGGFASGTVGGIRTRRYHALLLTATKPPTGRMVLVNGFEASIVSAHSEVAITAQRYLPDTLAPASTAPVSAFRAMPWPSWQFALPDGSLLSQDILVDPASGSTILRWKGPAATTLRLRPLLSGRDYHALHHENPDFDFSARRSGGNVGWKPYAGVPGIVALSNARYRHEPLWYRNFLYTAERDRGLDDAEDLAAPGVFEWALGAEDAVMLLRAGEDLDGEATPLAAHIIAGETARRAQPALRLAAEAYVAHRAGGATILAGFPWFTDWGRDTFIAMRGLLLAENQVATATSVLLAWADQVSEGMLPNRFTDDGPPEYNTCDASLWFIVAAHDLMAETGVSDEARLRLRQAIDAILAGHIAGTRFGIGMTPDGFLRAGEPGTQLTWMDARSDGRAVTPRVGKPVEIQALWYNALRIAAQWDPAMAARADAVKNGFLARFIDETTGGLADVVDVDHVTGTRDVSIRPNQIFAVGGLPFALLEGAAAAAVLAVVHDHLLTPMGLRTLSPISPAYRGRYAGGPAERDAAYHQGTVWPWLIGPFVEAWLRVHGDTPSNRAQARQDFLRALETHLGVAGIGHISEVAGGDAPHTPGGCPFQAWSLGEFLRVKRMTAP